MFKGRLDLSVNSLHAVNHSWRCCEHSSSEVYILFLSPTHSHRRLIESLSIEITACCCANDFCCLLCKAICPPAGWTLSKLLSSLCVLILICLHEKRSHFTRVRRAASIIWIVLFLSCIKCHLTERSSRSMMCCVMPFNQSQHARGPANHQCSAPSVAFTRRFLFSQSNVFKDPGNSPAKLRGDCQTFLWNEVQYF